MSVLIAFVSVIIVIAIAGSFGYLFWRVLDRRDVTRLRGHVEGLERRLSALESERRNQNSSVDTP